MDERRTRRTNSTKIRNCPVRCLVHDWSSRNFSSIDHVLSMATRAREGRQKSQVEFLLSLSLSPSKRSSKGGDDLFGKEAREEDARMLSFTRRLVLFLQYTSLPRVGRVLSLEGVRRGTKVEKKKRNKECIYIYVCVMSRQIFQSWLKLCFRDQVTFHSTDDSL